MPTRKEVIALRWANKTEEEKRKEREKNAEKVRKFWAKNGRKKRSEMNPSELQRQRLMDLNNMKEKKKRMTEEEKSAARAKDRERKARKKSKCKGKEEEKKKDIEERRKNSRLVNELSKFGKRKKKQLTNNCWIQQRLRADRTNEEEEEIQVRMVKNMREKRSKLSVEGQMLARIQAREGMREWRGYGCIREYKQRKKRKSYNPHSWKIEPDAVREYYAKKKQEETEQDRKEESKRKNRIRVERHRLKIKKLLQDPVIIEYYGEKSQYELVREKNIREREKMMKKSGLFD